jgi:DNA replication protein DnaC
MKIETVCTCGRDLKLEIKGTGSRWLEAMAKCVKCEECSARLDREAEEAERRAARESRRSRCRMPNKLRGELLADFPARPEQRAAVEAARSWADGAITGLMLTGPVGTGKTRIAASACWTRLERRHCTYASVARAIARLGASLTDEGRREAISVFAGQGAIVLDDLDKARPSEYGKEQVFAAIDAREQAGAPLLVTTNLEPSGIAERYGEAVASRLVGYCRIVEVGGDDLRLAA